MAEKSTATSRATIDARPERIWNAIMDPDLVSQAFFGAKVDTDWQVGSPITWTGEWEGKPFRDTGEIRKVDQPHELVFTHYEHVVTFDLQPVDGSTEVTITQTNAGSPEEREHSEENWDKLLETLKEITED
jgi:uncharacterized protein YndB with AHSA1/START domain